MSRINLTLQSLKELDFGKISAEYQKLLEFIVKDCWERPNDGKARKVVLQFEAEPITDGIDCQGVTARFKMKASTPDRQSRDYQLGVTKAGHLYFQEDSPDSPDQESLKFDSKEGSDDE